MHYRTALPAFFLLCLLCHAGAGAQDNFVAGAGQPLSVMTYNLRLDVASDSANAWPHRRDFLAGQVAFHAPDILGTQEGLPTQIEWLDRHLLHYDRIGEGREGGHRGEYSAIFYNRHRFTVRESGTFWLSETPDTVSTGWDAALPRIVTWGRFAERSGDREFYAFNTHFDHRGEEARLRSAELILRMIDSLNAGGLPFVLTGDFNLEPESPPLRLLAERLTDAYAKAPVRLGPAGTFTGFAYDEPAVRRIDYVFTGPGVEVRRAATLTDAIDGRFPSDHFPVLAGLRLRPVPTVIAHRGASGYALENSLAAFREAVELGADMIELDVFTLADGAVVCFHDDQLRRLTGVEGKITDYTLDRLNDLSLTDGSRIPLLSTALAVMDKQLRVNIELKGPGTAEPTYRVIEQAIRDHGWKIEDFHVSSFRHDELRAMRALDAGIEIGILPHGSPVAALDVGREVGASSINANQGSLNAETVGQIHAAGFRIYAWTVNAPDDIRRLLDLNIDGFITNYPDRVQRLAAE